MKEYIYPVLLVFFSDVFSSFLVRMCGLHALFGGLIL
jgi:hypothetical protein